MLQDNQTYPKQEQYLMEAIKRCVQVNKHLHVLQSNVPCGVLLRKLLEVVANYSAWIYRMHSRRALHQMQYTCTFPKEQMRDMIDPINS